MRSLIVLFLLALAACAPSAPLLPQPSAVDAQVAPGPRSPDTEDTVLRSPRPAGPGDAPVPAAAVDDDNGDTVVNATAMPAPEPEPLEEPPDWVDESTFKIALPPPGSFGKHLAESEDDDDGGGFADEPMTEPENPAAPAPAPHHPQRVGTGTGKRVIDLDSAEAASGPWPKAPRSPPGGERK